MTEGLIERAPSVCYNEGSRYLFRTVTAVFSRWQEGNSQKHNHEVCEMKNKEFSIIDDGIRIHAKLDFPEALLKQDEEGGQQAKCPLLIIIHGFTGHMEETHIIAAAEVAHELGMASLRVDMYGHGISDGKFEDHTLFKWMTQAMAITDYARSLPFVTDLYLCGHSQGGLMTILTAGLKPDVFKAIIPLAPATSIPEGAREGDILGITFDPAHIPDMFEMEEGRQLKGNYAAVAQAVYPEHFIRRYTGPVLIVHADTDEAVPYRCAVEAAALYTDAKLVTVKDDTHCFDNHLDEMTAAMREFLAELV